MQRLIFTERRPLLWRTIAAFVAGVLFASLILGVTKAHGADLKEFKVDTGKRELIYRVPDCIKAKIKIVKQRHKGAAGLKFFCDGRRI